MQTANYVAPFVDYNQGNEGSCFLQDKQKELEEVAAKKKKEE
jgi:hypothetical protein